MQTTPWPARAARKSRAAKLLSATITRSRPGSHLRACRTTCLPHSGSFLCRLPCSRLCRSEGASAVRNGSAQMRSAQGIGTSSITLSQRRPDAFEMPVAGADRVAIDACGGDALATATLDRVVEAEHHGTVRCESLDQQPQQ